MSVAAPPFTLAPHTIDVASADIQNMATSVAALFTSKNLRLFVIQLLVNSKVDTNNIQLATVTH